MLESVNFAKSLSLISSIAGIFSVMLKGYGESGIDHKRRNAMHRIVLDMGHPALYDIVGEQPIRVALFFYLFIKALSLQW